MACPGPFRPESMACPGAPKNWYLPAPKLPRTDRLCHPGVHRCIRPHRHIQRFDKASMEGQPLRPPHLRILRHPQIRTYRLDPIPTDQDDSRVQNLPWTNDYPPTDQRAPLGKPRPHPRGMNLCRTQKRCTTQPQADSGHPHGKHARSSRHAGQLETASTAHTRSTDRQP